MAMPRARAQGRRHLRSPILPGGRRTFYCRDQFFGRPEWAAIRMTYGISFREQRQMQPEFMYSAVANGNVDVIAEGRTDAQFNLAGAGRPPDAIPPMTRCR